MTLIIFIQCKLTTQHITHTIEPLDIGLMLLNIQALLFIMEKYSLRIAPRMLCMKHMFWKTHEEQETKRL